MYADDTCVQYEIGSTFGCLYAYVCKVFITAITCTHVILIAVDLDFIIVVTGTE